MAKILGARLSRFLAVNMRFSMDMGPAASSLSLSDDSRMARLCSSRTSILRNSL